MLERKRPPSTEGRRLIPTAVLLSEEERGKLLKMAREGERSISQQIRYLLRPHLGSSDGQEAA